MSIPLWMQRFVFWWLLPAGYVPCQKILIQWSTCHVVEWEIHIISCYYVNTSEEHFQHLVEALPQIIKAVLKATGCPTQYWQGRPNKLYVVDWHSNNMGHAWSQFLLLQLDLTPKNLNVHIIFIYSSSWLVIVTQHHPEQCRTEGKSQLMTSKQLI